MNILRIEAGKDVPKSKIYNINNGIDLEVYNENKLNKTVEDSDLEDKNF